MSQKPAAEVDPVADAIANAPQDDRPVSAEERNAIAEAKADPNPLWIDGDVVSAEIAEWARRERAKQQ
jgi:hypothetical protein